MSDAPDIKQQTLDLTLAEEPTRPFISDWNGTHPYAAAYLGDPNLYVPDPHRAGHYLWMLDMPEIVDAVRQVHRGYGEPDIGREQILAGPGSSSFTTLYILRLASEGVDEVFYIPPIYYSFHYAAKLAGVRLRPVSGRQAFEAGFTMNLPRKRTHLILTDPIWYAGIPLRDAVVDDVRRWQLDTGSEVFVDGSFQFLKWNGDRCEPTSHLPADQTIRLLCPSKSLGIPIYRFAYAIMPAGQMIDFRWCYETVLGSNSAGDVAFAKRSLEVLASTEGNRAFAAYLGETYLSLKRDHIIESDLEPTCNYLVFVKLARTPARPYHSMDQSYFEQSRYPGYVRVNLMAAAELRRLLQ
jgi:histidinol-phosphate/aromatic aminotransferase/cobyric acid decarboxylase-like protein